MLRSKMKLRTDEAQLENPAHSEETEMNINKTEFNKRLNIPHLLRDTPPYIPYQSCLAHIYRLFRILYILLNVTCLVLCSACTPRKSSNPVSLCCHDR